MVNAGNGTGPGTTEILETKRSHAWAILLMVTGAAILYGFVFLGLEQMKTAHGISAWSRLRPAEQLDLGCYVFLLSWWIAYFSRSSFSKEHTLRSPQLFTLRGFLDGISSHRGAPVTEGPDPNVDELTEDAWRTERAAARLAEKYQLRGRPFVTEGSDLAKAWRLADDAHHDAVTARRKVDEDQRDEGLIREKARSSRDVQGIMIAVVVLLLTLIVVDRPATATEFHTLIGGPIFAVAIAIILMWGLSIDIFDTMLNSFQVDIQEANELRRHYYRKIGPLRNLSGAVSYGYVGHALMPIFVLMVFSWFEPVVAGFGTALYVLFAYPYYFGYWGVHTRDPAGVYADWEQKNLPRSWKQEGESITRWVVNRDGDRDVRSIGAIEVKRSGAPVARYWPPWVVCAIFLVPSILIMWYST